MVIFLFFLNILRMVILKHSFDILMQFLIILDNFFGLIVQFSIPSCKNLQISPIINMYFLFFTVNNWVILKIFKWLCIEGTFVWSFLRVQIKHILLKNIHFIKRSSHIRISGLFIFKRTNWIKSINYMNPFVDYFIFIPENVQVYYSRMEIWVHFCIFSIENCKIIFLLVVLETIRIKGKSKVLISS